MLSIQQEGNDRRNIHYLHHIFDT